jgi:hypothetical protein
MPKRNRPAQHRQTKCAKERVTGGDGRSKTADGLASNDVLANKQQTDHEGRHQKVNPQLACRRHCRKALCVEDLEGPWPFAYFSTASALSTQNIAKAIAAGIAIAFIFIPPMQVA